MATPTPTPPAASKPIKSIGYSPSCLSCNPCLHQVVQINYKDGTIEVGAFNGKRIAEMMVENGLPISDHFAHYLTEEQKTKRLLGVAKGKGKKGKGKLSGGGGIRKATKSKMIAYRPRPKVYPGIWGDPAIGKSIWEAENSLRFDS